MFSHRRNRFVGPIRVSVVVALALVSLSSLAIAAVGVGPRVGVSSDPDQIFGGIHWNYGEITRNVQLRPSVELGLGDDVFSLAANADVAYEFTTSGRWKPYLGGAVSLFYYKFDVPFRVNRDDDDISAGLSLVGGARTQRSNGGEFLIDLKLGLTNRTPDFKAAVGWTF